MATLRILYGSTTGNTEDAARFIAQVLGDKVECLKDISKAAPGDLSGAGALILGTSTWDDGQLQQDWEAFFPKLDGIDLSGKKVALFGLGNAQGFSGQFVNALGKLHRKVLERGGEVVGLWPVEGYTFRESEAVVGDKFCGLVLDNENEQEKTRDRIMGWLEQIKAEIGL